MDLMHLTYFSALCETLNYTQAAKKCFITRQAMRQSVQTLEQAFNVRLVENRQNHLSLTPAGKQLYESARPVLKSWNELSREMDRFHLSSEKLRIGISRSITPYYAEDILKTVQSFPATHPEIPIQTELLTADDILRMLEDGKLDAGILVDMGDIPLPFRRTILRTDALTIMLSATHPLAAKKI